jgi:diaminopimelate decarboxylase
LFVVEREVFSINKFILKKSVSSYTIHKNGVEFRTNSPESGGDSKYFTMDLWQLFPISTGRTKEGGLSISGHSLAELAGQYGTPLYIYDAPTIRKNVFDLNDYLSALYPGDHEITYASKAYVSKPFAKKMAKYPIGFDVVSRGEMNILRKSGIQPGQVHFHGNNKSEEELRQAVDWGVHAIVVDSLEELDFLAEIARKMNQIARIWLRITPTVDLDTHPYVQTATDSSKFGLPIADGQAKAGIRKALNNPYLKLTGLHIHLGSQIFNAEPFERALHLLYKLAEAEDYVLEAICPGGGWGVPYTPDGNSTSPKTWVEVISRAIQKESEQRGWPLPQLILEPGRWIVAQAGVAVYTIGTTKFNMNGDYVIAVDGGMADNPRPALYQSQYITKLVERPDAVAEYNAFIVGKFCESGDQLICGYPMPKVRRGELLVIPVAGAYQISMSSNYNLADRPAVLWLDDGKVELLQAREIPEESNYWLGL